MASSGGVPFDIEGGARIVTHHPVEKFVLKWEITNFSRVGSSPVEAKFSTAGGLLRWKVSRVTVGVPEVFRLTLLTKSMRVMVTYEFSFIGKDGTASMKQNGCECFDINNLSNDETDVMSKMIFYGRISINEHVMPNGALTVQCVMFVQGHPMTTVHPMPSATASKLSILSSDLNDFLQKREHCDFSLHVSEETFPVHKAILCARSPVFHKMLQNNVIENTQNRAEINDVEADTFRDFVTFLYTGETKDLSWEKVLKLYYVADKYDVGSLREVCSEFMKFHLDINQVCDVLTLAHRHGNEELKNVAKLFARMQSSAVKETAAWAQLLTTNPKLALEIF